MAIPGGDLQPLDRPIRIRLSRRQLSGIDRLAAEFGISRSWFIREAGSWAAACGGAHSQAHRGRLPAGRGRCPRPGFGSPPGSHLRRRTFGSLGLRAGGPPSPSSGSRPCLRRGVMVSRPPVPSSGFDELSLALRRPFFAVGVAALPPGCCPRCRLPSRLFGCRRLNLG